MSLLFEKTQHVVLVFGNPDRQLLDGEDPVVVCDESNRVPVEAGRHVDETITSPIEQWILPREIEEVWVVWPDYQLWSAHGRSPDSGAPYHNVVTSILLDGVTKHHGSTVALANLTLRVEDGEAVVLVGPTGSGKTSILRLIAGLDEPSEGDILIDGTPREEGEVTDVAMFFAETLLYPKMTGRENVAFPLTVKKVAEPERSHRVDAEAAVLGITRILERKPGHMSAGQRQLIQLAKAMVRGPSLFLVDEPLSSIDGPSRAIIRRELRKVQSGYGATAVYATHDQDDAMTLADRLVVLDRGRVRQVGPPSNVYREPVDRFVATFLGTPEMGIFPATRTARGVRVESLELTTPGVVPERVQVGVRPEDWVPGDRGVDAKVLKVTPWSPQLATVDMAGVTTQIRLTGHDPGATLTLHPSRFHVFDADTGQAVHHHL